ncbi:Rho GTPase, putative [Medicago truncatula]|uniref:Rho GTPase, putative n=2 Tax=Medicago truncatula TaxID=3880 RepID=A0A072USU2_MEDTR|nr:Rho GTPase, putative [Medicago truncatula]
MKMESRELLANKESLASCDIAIFVHDKQELIFKSNESSWKASSKLLVEIARHGEHTGFKVPCLIVAAKDDQYSFPMAVQESTRSEHGSRGSYIPISAMLGNLNSLFHRIVTAAEHPHLSIPKTEVGKNRKQYHRLHVPETEDENQRKLYHRLVNQTLMFVSVGAALAFVGVGACRIARKNK